jgi:NTP pyrophosphatase (non-canonical NTP hydrolase)
MSEPKTLVEMTAEVDTVNVEKGWRDTTPSFLEAMALLHTEVSEAVEAWRRWGTDDATKLWRTGDHGEPINAVNPKPEGVGSELADVLIRLLDTCALYGIDLQTEHERKTAYNRTRPHRHGGKRL